MNGDACGRKAPCGAMPGRVAQTFVSAVARFFVVLDGSKTMTITIEIHL